MTALAAAIALSACGLSGGAGTVAPAPAPPGSLAISPQNDGFTAGRNRLSMVIQDAQGHPLLGAEATVEVRSEPGIAAPPYPLVAVGDDFPNLPIYTGLIEVPHPGSWFLLVRTHTAFGADAGQAFITAVAPGSPMSAMAQLQVGDRMPRIVQPVVGPGVSLSSVDSGVPPDAWHDMTVADALAAHRALLIYVGEPGRCLSKTCGDMVAVLRRVCAAICASLPFEHIEVHYPADSLALNPAWIPFHFQAEQPWVYLVTGGGVIADRFEGPAPYDQVVAAARGTLLGKVPAV